MSGIRHIFVNTKTDGSDATVVRPSNWNDVHVIDSGTIVNAALAVMAANTLKGNNTVGSASPADLTTAQVKTMLAIAAGDVSGLATIATTGSGANLSAGTVANAALANMAANTLKGNNTGGSAVPVDLTVAQVRAMVGKIYLGTQILTGSGTYTPTSGTTRVRVRAVACGGGGGGASSASACAGGGGPGTYFEKWIDPSATITGGAFSAPASGGAGGASSGATGATGSDATIVIQGVTYTAKGGPGGTGSTGGVYNAPTSVVGGSSSGDVVFQGIGQAGWLSTGTIGLGGLGGGTPWGAGGRNRSTGDTGTGGAGTGFGSGGGGACNGTGGAGAAALILVDEYS